MSETDDVINVIQRALKGPMRERMSVWILRTIVLAALTLGACSLVYLSAIWAPPELWIPTWAVISAFTPSGRHLFRRRLTPEAKNVVQLLLANRFNR